MNPKLPITNTNAVRRMVQMAAAVGIRLGRVFHWLWPVAVLRFAVPPERLQTRQNRAKFLGRVFNEINPDYLNGYLTALIYSHVIGPCVRRVQAWRKGVFIPSTVEISSTQICNIECFGCYAA